MQAMDRCHRIGQNKPVLVFRLATSNSVEGKMLRRACDKMALERLVIKKGVFKEVLDTGKGAAAVSAQCWPQAALARLDHPSASLPVSVAVSYFVLFRRFLMMHWCLCLFLMSASLCTLLCLLQSAVSSTGMSASELLALLRSDISMDDVPQSGVVDDQTLDKLLDRTWMLTPEEQQQQADVGNPAPAAEQQPVKGKGRGKGKRSATAAAAAPPAGDAAMASASGREVQTGLPYPAQGVGYEVVQALQDSGLLSNVN